ncbi:MAG: TIGR03905 family TSCPD domain-containing protein [Oscillospiraceae bacterium]|nr:TIGR03905 family TSCPD domain-containing protein [Oscillospiraceae bacterium]
MRFNYTPKGTCSVNIAFDLDDGIVRNIQFTRGCHGNTQGVSRLAEGMAAEELISRLEGINCGNRGTSCPDQLAKAVKAALAQ